MKFEFATAGRILFGPGTLRELGTLSRVFGSRIAVLTGRDPNRHPAARESLAQAGLEIIPLAWTSRHSEPDVDFVMDLARRLRESGAQAVVGLGGGGVLDAAKAAAALATNPGDPSNYLEVVGRGQPLVYDPLPVIAVPTTAGTGSEVTRNSVLNVPHHRAKVSLRHPAMLPRIALVDPELTLSVPPDLTAATGMDALTQCLEPLVCNRTQPLGDALAWTGLKEAARSLRQAVAQGRDQAARESLSLAALCGGLALANAGLGVVHGIAGPLGGLYPGVPHGALCAALLAPAMAANLAALRHRTPAHPALARYQEIAVALTRFPGAPAEAGVDWVRQLAADLAIPNLVALGIDGRERTLILEKAQQASSMKANPIPLTLPELHQLLTEAGLP